MLKRIHLLAALAALSVLLLAGRAEATHFRYGNITYTRLDPVNAPRTVRFEVTMAWRAGFVGSSTLNFGDAIANPDTTGFEIGSGVDASGLLYKFFRYTVTHQYPNTPQMQYTAFFTSCCRLSNLLSGANDQTFRVEAKVDLSPGNTGNPISVVPAIIQLQVGAPRSHFIPAVDPDGQPVTCRFGTTAESSLPTNPPVAELTGAVPVLTPSANPPGCLLSWNLTGATAGPPIKQYALQVVLESLNNGAVSSGVHDYIIEFVNAPPPTCAGSGTFTIPMGTTFSTDMIGTNNTMGPNLKMTYLGSTGTVTPIPGTTAPSPFTSTLSWTPGLGEAGSYVVGIVYTDQLSLSGFCALTLVVPPCPEYLTPCSAGVGECASPGILQCIDGNVICTAVAGQPTPEVCDGLDNNCDGVNDEGNPDSGQACTTGFEGVCAPGISDCSNNFPDCIPNIDPGTLPETCDGTDENCDGAVDEGFNNGDTCQAGIGACQSGGFIICDAMGGAVCDAVAGTPQPELCNGVDDDCDTETDEDFPVGGPCESGVGECLASGVFLCDGMIAVCDAVPGAPVPEICGNMLDEDCTGTSDNDCNDTDDDGILDQIEEDLGLDPDDADTDDDGAVDGDEPSYDLDSDDDGLINARDPDSDNDGLYDGTELALDCNGPGTDVSRRHCRADADPATTTDPLLADSDGATARDGSEDTNLNGAVDPGEQDPSQAGDDGDAVDTDGDGLSDALEAFVFSNPDDDDSDDDGLLDGSEANPADDTDGDWVLNVLDVDSDNDALFDGTETGTQCMNPDTSVEGGHCVEDLDAGAAKTSPVKADTDDGGVSDGAEDTDLNGRLDPDDQDPNLGEDDGDVLDDDGDGLSNGQETTLGSDPADADSDDDGLLDGSEANPGDDGDGDGLLNLLDADSDADELFDGLEAGQDCADPDTAADAQTCVADEDGGDSTTSPVASDTDHGGVVDGEEDTNKNGVVDPGERDPNNGADDMVPSCVTDADCGEAQSGKVCDVDMQVCVDGCRGVDGNGCPAGQVCSSTDATIGQCQDSVGAGTPPPPPPAEESGCDCRTAPGRSSDFPWWLVLAAGVTLLRRKR